MEAFAPLISSPWLWITIVVLYTLKKGIYFVPQNRGYVIYTLGKYDKTLSAGLNFIIPFIQSVAADRNLKEQSLDISSQSAITKDNISLELDGILFMKVTDAAAATNNNQARMANNFTHHLVCSVTLANDFQKFVKNGTLTVVILACLMAGNNQINNGKAAK